MSFGSILEGPDTTQLKPLVEQAMPMLIETMRDSSVVVQVDIGSELFFCSCFCLRKKHNIIRFFLFQFRILPENVLSFSSDFAIYLWKYQKIWY